MTAQHDDEQGSMREHEDREDGSDGRHGFLHAAQIHDGEQADSHECKGKLCR
jgi:hypothetical protein